MKTYYKVVKESPYSSAKLSCLAPESLTVTYSTGRYTEAPKHMAVQGYYLLVFDDLETAKTFSKVNGGGGFEVWEAKVQEVVVHIPPKYNVWSIPNVWVLVWPPGTIMVKKVKLLRKVENE